MRFIYEEDPNESGFMMVTVEYPDGKTIVFNAEMARSLENITTFEQFEKMASVGGACMQMAMICQELSSSLAAEAKKYPHFLAEVIGKAVGLTNKSSKFIPYNPGVN